MLEAQYDALVAMRPELIRKGKKTPYTSLNGHMHSFLSPEGNLGLRLSKTDRAECMETLHVEIMRQYNHNMPEYVCIPGSLLLDHDTLLPWLDKSYAYVSSLSPKPTKAKK